MLIIMLLFLVVAILIFIIYHERLFCGFYGKNTESHFYPHALITSSCSP